MSRRLGKKPFAPDPRDLRLLSLVAPAALPTPPARFGYSHAFRSWGTLGNDRYGDCVWAGAAHETMLWAKSAGQRVAFTDDVVLGDYAAATGFRPNVPSTDQGTDVRQALLFRRDAGIADAAGQRHRIGAFVALHPGDWDQLLQACYVFLAVGIGFEFPDTAMNQFSDGHAWDVVPGARVDGGHYVPVVGRSAKTFVNVITWGKAQRMSRRFYETYCDEAWAFVSPDELHAGKNHRGLDLARLNAALAQLHA